VLFERLCRALGAEGLLEDPDYASSEARSGNRDRLNDAFAAITRTAPSRHWIEVLNGAGVPCGRSYDMAQVFADPQVGHLGIAWPMEPPRSDASRWSARR
jgi:crotonobetainyl-CoA:carnitine CoA-transferase CaiB-like acyl-CoA transferase